MLRQILSLVGCAELDLPCFLGQRKDGLLGCLGPDVLCHRISNDGSGSWGFVGLEGKVDRQV